MNLSKAISLAARWSEGHVCTLRDGEAREYHKLCHEALKRMREQSKVVDSDQFEGCEYCRDSKDIYETVSLLHDSYNTYVYISENSLVVDIGCHSYGTAAIKFCPMCGRRLEEV